MKDCITSPKVYLQDILDFFLGGGSYTAYQGLGGGSCMYLVTRQTIEQVKNLTWRRHWMNSQGIIKVLAVCSEVDMNVQFNCNPTRSCWDVSVWSTVEDPLTPPSIHNWKTSLCTLYYRDIPNACFSSFLKSHLSFYHSSSPPPLPPPTAWFFVFLQRRVFTVIPLVPSLPGKTMALPVLVRRASFVLWLVLYFVAVEIELGSRPNSIVKVRFIGNRSMQGWHRFYLQPLCSAISIYSRMTS